jgi:hypothetical protein
MRCSASLAGCPSASQVAVSIAATPGWDLAGRRQRQAFQIEVSPSNIDDWNYTIRLDQPADRRGVRRA